MDFVSKTPLGETDQPEQYEKAHNQGKKSNFEEAGKLKHGMIPKVYLLPF